ncbi:MAG: TRAP transporter small permease [Desulfovermiculus sp.]|nr:TRAP transporter small permease [Desulfovermiculus sp.]
MNKPKTFSLWLGRAVSRLSSAGAILSSAAFVFMVGLIVLEVILRSFFGKSTLIASEYSGYLLAAMIYLGLGFSFREGAHIRITFLQNRMPPLAYHWMDIFCHLAAAFLCVLSTLFLFDTVLTSYERGLQAYTVAETPLYIPQAVVLLGLFLFSLQVLARLVHLLFNFPGREQTD